jgi:hypothetical protein
MSRPGNCYMYHSSIAGCEEKSVFCSCREYGSFRAHL